MHLEEIFQKGVNGTVWDIPSKFYLVKDIISEQLEAMKSLERSPPCKLKKRAQEPSPSKTEPIASSSKSVHAEIGSAEPSTSMEGSIKLKKNEIGMNLKDFFKERATQQKMRFEAEKKIEPAPSNHTKSNLEKKKDTPVNPEFFANKGHMATKLKNAAPYNIFLTTIDANEMTSKEPLSVTFQELFDASLGELESSVQFNFTVDIAWLYNNYYKTGNGNLPLLILYGKESNELQTISSKKPNITAIHVKISTKFGCHHTKMMLFSYKDQSMRIVISTANLYEEDWQNRVQGLWISERLPIISEGCNCKDGESVTGFREDFLKYLMTYNIPNLQPWIARFRKTDFSSINVFFLASSPGSHRPDPRKGHPFGHPRLGNLLGQYSARISENCPIIAQCSAIGNLGRDAQAYLLSEIATSFRRDSSTVASQNAPQLKLIYPSLLNVETSYDGIMGGGCLPYTRKSNSWQTWLQSYLYQWRSESRNRTRALPHIKSYLRYSEEDGLYWFCLTSANLSRSAWGSYNKSSKSESMLNINSYEAGVVFFPQIMVSILSRTFFKIKFKIYCF